MYSISYSFGYWRSDNPLTKTLMAKCSQKLPLQTVHIDKILCGCVATQFHPPNLTISSVEETRPRTAELILQIDVSTISVQIQSA